MAVAPTSADPIAPAALLERESAQRNRAGIAALLSALFVTVSFLIASSISAKAPGVLITDALRDGAGGTLNGKDGPGLLAENLTYLHEKAVVSGLGTLLEVLSWAGFVVLLLFLFDATRGRRAELPVWVRALLLASTLAAIVGAIMIWAGQTISFSDFVSGSDHSSQAARDAVSSPVVAIGNSMGGFGKLGVAIAWVVISLNAMRAGLLTRFLGMLGIFGALLTFVILQVPIIQIFWLVAVGLTVLGKAPAGQPPAWTSGKAEPWPTQQQIREQRERIRQEAEGSKPADDDASAEGSTPAPAARKRKRRS